MRFAVCDKQPAVTSQIDSLLMALGSTCSQRFEVLDFFSCENFCKYVRDTATFFDIIIMDAEQLGPIGSDFGARLRESLAGSRSLLILTSRRKSFYNQVIDLNVFCFLKKPLDAKNFLLKVDIAVKKAAQQLPHVVGPDLIVRKNRRAIHIPLHKIMYLESDIRQIHLQALSDSLTYYATLNAEAEKLPKDIFTRIHKSYLISFAYVVEISPGEVVMKDGRTLPISGRYRESVKAAYHRYQEEIRY